MVTAKLKPAKKKPIDELSRDTTETQGAWFAWEAPAFAYYKKGWVWQLLFLIIGLGLIAYFYLYDDRNYSAMGVVIATLVVLWQQAQEQPKIVRYEIGDTGFRMGDKLFTWQELKSFWLADGEKYQHLYLETTNRWPPVQTVHLANVESNALRARLVEHLPEHTTQGELWTDRLIRWMKL